MTFEQRIARLEAIVGELEREPLEVARALALFEEGIACLRVANDELTRVESRVRTLVERPDGSFDLEDQ